MNELEWERPEEPSGRTPATPARQSAAAWHFRAADAGTDLLAASLPGGPAVPLRSVRTLLAMNPQALGVLDHANRRSVSAAMILAHTRYGGREEAAGLVARESDHRLALLDGELSASTLTHFWSAVAEAHVTAGSTQDGAEAARLACAYAEESADDALRYRASGVLAVCLAMNGEFPRAAELIEQADALAALNGWTPDGGVYPICAAQVLLASSQMDGGALARIAADLRVVTSGPPGLGALTALAEAAASITDGRTEDGVAALTLAANSVEASTVPPLIHSFMVSYLATLLVSRGDPQRALALLSGRRSDQHHTVCLDLQRASAHLQLGNDRAVLATTSSCMRITSEHNPRTLAAVLLRRAIAYERLHVPALADAAFADAFQLIRRSDAATPLLTLPPGEVDVLLGRLQNARRDLTEDVDAVRKRLRRMPTAEPPATTAPVLTARETVIAWQIRGGHTLAEIAGALHVSRNTVKSQTASLYRKLAVTSREEAIAELERTGFFDYGESTRPTR